MFKKNTAVIGFGIGHFINASTGAAVTTGTPTCKRTIDGTGGACANAASYNTNGAVWEIDLSDTDMNGDVIVLSFTLTDCIPISYTIRTSTVLLSETPEVNTTKVSGTSQTARDLGAGVVLTEAGILAIWHQLLANITTAGTVGKLIKDDLDAAITSRSTYNPATDEVNVGKIKGASLVETKSAGGSIAAGVSYFFDTDTPGKDMNDVGGGSIELDPEAAAALAADIAAGLLDQPAGGTGKIKVDLRGRVIAAKGGVF